MYSILLLIYSAGLIMITNKAEAAPYVLIGSASLMLVVSVCGLIQKLRVYRSLSDTEQ